MRKDLHCQARIGDCLSAFTLPHWMIALGATGRWDAARKVLEAMRGVAHGNGTVERPAGRVALARYAH
jgi:hypothetical protein